MGKIDEAAEGIASLGQLGISLYNMSDAGYRKNAERQVTQQKKLTDIQVGANKDLMQEQYGYSLDMMQRNQQWNAMAAQRQRLEEAGLNPALMYQSGGGGGTTMGVNSSAPSAGGGVASGEAERQQAKTAQMGMAMNLAMMKAQIDNIKADTKEKLQGAENKGAETEGLMIGNEIREATKEFEISLVKGQVESQVWANELARRQIDGLVENLKKQGENIDEDTKKKVAERRKIEVESALGELQKVYDTVRNAHAEDSIKAEIQSKLASAAASAAAGELAKAEEILKALDAEERRILSPWLNEQNGAAGELAGGAMSIMKNLAPVVALVKALTGK